jgi:hypothetical protein
MKYLENPFTEDSIYGNIMQTDKGEELASVLIDTAKSLGQKNPHSYALGGLISFINQCIMFEVDDLDEAVNEAISNLKEYLPIIH